jgi:predicted O-methyltransferase YrrM
MRSPEEIVYNLTIPGWMWTKELEHLDSLVSLLLAGSTVVEIGSLHGRSAYCMAKSNKNIVLYCVDLWLGNKTIIPVSPYKNTIEVFREFTKDCPNIIAMQTVKTNVVWNDSMVDMVFIDAGAHTNPIEWDIIQYWLPRIKPGGILCGHDYHTNFPDVIANVNKLSSMGYTALPMTFGSMIWGFVI